MSKKITLVCKSCNGKMEFDSNKNVMNCPFCGSKEILIESDKVKIEQIKAEVEMEKIKHEERKPFLLLKSKMYTSLLMIGIWLIFTILLIVMLWVIVTFL